MLDQILNFIERHGDSLFSPVDSPNEAMVRDRAGWWDLESNTKVYLFTEGGMREALKGFDLKRSLDILVSVGALPKPKEESAERLKQRKIEGSNTKVYEINPEKLASAISRY